MFSPKANMNIYFLCQPHSHICIFVQFKFDHSLVFSWASLLVKCIEDVACKSSHNNSYNKK